MQDLSWQVVPLDELSKRASVWNGFIRKAGYPVFLRTEFLQPAISIFGCAQGVAVFGYAGSELCAVGILQRVGFGRWEMFQPSQLPLGAWAMARDLQWDHVLPSLLRALPGVSLTVSITQQDPHFVSRPQPDGNLETVDYIRTAWIDVTGTFDDYWQKRGKNLRQNLRKQRRKLEQDAAPLTFEFLESREDVAAALADFAALESSGWKASQGTAISLDNPQGRFYSEMLGTLAAEGAAFAMRLSRQGKPIAVDFGVKDASCLVILKTTYDESLSSASPGQLLHEMAFQHLFEHAGTPRIEFYGKVMEWHTRWTEEARTLFHINYYRSSALVKARTLLKGLRARQEPPQASESPVSAP